MNLSDVAIRRPVFTTMMMVAMMVLGIVAFTRLGVDLFPDISFPVVVVSTVYPGAGPEEVERSVTKPVEEAVSALAGIDTVQSFSREGVSVVVASFEIGTDIDLAALDVRDRVGGAVRQMPEDAEDPTFLKVDPSAAPVMTLVLASDRAARDVRDMAEDNVKPLLERIEGVAVVNVRGGASREIQVQLSADKLAAYGISVGQVSQMLKAENLDVPGGRLDEDSVETSLRVVGTVRTPAEIEDFVVGQAQGATVRVRDVGLVLDTTAERRTIIRVDGEEAVSLEVLKQGGTNMVAVADGVYATLDKARAALPPDAKLSVVSDSSVFIRENANQVEEELVIGGLAAIAIIFFFMLDWRSTFISALALPTSVVATFAVMYVAGFTLNMMTLLGLSLSIGLLIDDAIVVRESIYRHIEAGEPPMLAASNGTKEIALAVMATTFTILAVFIPVAFMGGIIGQFFKQFALTISAAVLVSLFVAFTLDPMLSARLVKQHDPNVRETENVVARNIRRMLDAMDEGYRTMLAWSLGHRKTVLFASVVMLAASVATVALTGMEFFPKPDRGQFSIAVTLPAGSSLDATSKVVTEMEGMLQADKDVQLVYATVGVNEEARRAKIRVNAVPKSERDRTQNQMMADIRKQFAKFAGVKFSLAEAGMVDGDMDVRESPIALSVRGPDMATLAETASKIEAMVRATPGSADISSTYAPGQPELRARIDRTAASAVGLSGGGLGMSVRSAVVGDVATRFRDGEDDIDVRVQLSEADRNSREALAGLLIPTPTGLVPLRQIATLENRTGPSTIERQDRQRQITITGEVALRPLSDVVSDIQAGIAKMDLPPGYTTKFGGEAERMAETNKAFGVAMLLAIIFVYIVLASQFESFLHPFTIMVSLPLAIVGALLGLFLSGYTMGMSAMIGIILLMGLVTKNAILLVDLTNTLRDEGADAIDAIMTAGPRRLRPILMTSAAMVLGMMPTATGQGPGSEFRAPMAIAIIGGVITSTMLTLVVVPIVYLWFDKWTARHKREDEHHSHDHEAPPAGPHLVEGAAK